MAAAHLVFLVEELSTEAFLRGLLPRLLPQDRTFEVHPFQGKSDLLGKLEVRLRGYAAWLPAHWRVVVVVDRDDDDCRGLKRRLEATARRVGLRTRSRSGASPYLFWLWTATTDNRQMLASLSREEAVGRLVEAEPEIRALGVQRLALFGSVLSGGARPDSDVDLLVQFSPDAKTFDRFLALSELLEARLERRIELVTTEALSPFIGPRILAQAQDVLRAA